MPIFKVSCFTQIASGDNAGKFDNTPDKEVIADDAKAAAEQCCGGPLVDRGAAGNLRAQVYLDGKPSEKTLFYRQP